MKTSRRQGRSVVLGDWGEFRDEILGRWIIHDLIFLRGWLISLLGFSGVG